MHCQLPNSLSHHPTFLNNRPSCIEDGGSGHFSFSTLASVGLAGVEASAAFVFGLSWACADAVVLLSCFFEMFLVCSS
jgi:hypothetical protein